MSNNVTTASSASPMSALMASPTITVHLVLPASREQADVEPEDTGPSTPTNSTKRTADEAFAAESPKVDPRTIITTSRLHTSVLTDHSDYFKSLISFNGLEVSQNCVYLETPIPNTFYSHLSEVAFNCFVDHIYTGDYNLSKYKVEVTDGTTVAVNKLLNIRLKKRALVRMRRILLNLSPWVRTGEKSTFVELTKTAGVIFSGTASLRNDVCPDLSDEQWATKDTCLLDSKERTSWLGNEPIRKLLAACLAEGWMLSREETSNIQEGMVLVRRRLIELYPELGTLVLGYLIAAVKLRDLPLSEFALEKADLALD
ncbi:hypothetical protein BJ508DRAFT_333889 [Ascobolus immersus RN42]|uniref:BTB domain-containing protein n=1 Tax=Ascobolus immersus RN42 TaxID=1160509 RepID=A0A3N4HVH1_ASCIM|nr:hypothetical protein BJ508DRAFT_333889 [Ascobolus immersus RN42]